MVTEEADACSRQSDNNRTAETFIISEFCYEPHPSCLTPGSFQSKPIKIYRNRLDCIHTTPKNCSFFATQFLGVERYVYQGAIHILLHHSSDAPYACCRMVSGTYSVAWAQRWWLLTICHVTHCQSGLPTNHTSGATAQRRSHCHRHSHNCSPSLSCSRCCSHKRSHNHHHSTAIVAITARPTAIAIAAAVAADTAVATCK